MIINLEDDDDDDATFPNSPSVLVFHFRLAIFSL